MLCNQGCCIEAREPSKCRAVILPAFPSSEQHVFVGNSLMALPTSSVTIPSTLKCSM